jgi:hypothetical protein
MGRPRKLKAPQNTLKSDTEQRRPPKAGEPAF